MKHILISLMGVSQAKMRAIKITTSNKKGNKENQFIIFARDHLKTLPIEMNATSIVFKNSDLF